MKLIFLTLFITSAIVISCSKNDFDEKSKGSSKNTTDKKCSVTASSANPKDPFVFIKQLGNGDLGSNILDSSAVEYLDDFEMDSCGNFIIAGYVRGNFNATQSVANQDAFILKLDPNGSFLWLKQFTDSEALINDSSNREYIRDLAIDSDGNIYATGETEGDFGEANGGTDADMFFMKLNPSGEIQWLKHIGNTTIADSTGKEFADFVNTKYGVVADTSTTDYAQGIGLDSSNNIYVLGSTAGTFQDTNGGNSDGVVIKLDSDGNFLLVKQFGSSTETHADINTTSGSQYFKKFKIGTDGNIYATLTLGSNFGELKHGSYDCGFMKLDSEANLIWLKQLGQGDFGTNNANDASAIEFCDHLALDSNNDLYIAGKTQGALFESTVNIGKYDTFVLKVSNSDGSIIWKKQFGDHTNSSNFGSNLNDTSFNDLTGGIALKGTNIYLSGSTKSSLGELNSNPDSNYDIFYISMSTDGSFNWIRHLGNGDFGNNLTGENNADGEDVSYNIVVDTNGFLYAAGITKGTLGELGNGTYDTFVLKMGIEE